MDCRGQGPYGGSVCPEPTRRRAYEHWATGPRGKGPLSVSHYSRAQTSPRHGPCTLLEPQALLNPEAAPWFQWWFILGTPDPSKAPT